MGTASPKMLLEYVHSSGEALATYDSFGFYLSCQGPDMPTDGLRFTPLATPEGECLIGFLYPRHAKLTLRARHTVGVLKQFLEQTCPTYYEEYPLR